MSYSHCSFCLSQLNPAAPEKLVSQVGFADPAGRLHDAWTQLSTYNMNEVLSFVSLQLSSMHMSSLVEAGKAYWDLQLVQQGMILSTSKSSSNQLMCRELTRTTTFLPEMCQGAAHLASRGDAHAISNASLLMVPWHLRRAGFLMYIDFIADRMGYKPI